MGCCLDRSGRDPEQKAVPAETEKEFLDAFEHVVAGPTVPPPPAVA